jgi:glucosamine--fructose-6-phosphate aminotransferase (isomerizing)
MADKLYHTKKEILSQTQAWKGALREVGVKKAFLGRFDFTSPQQIIFIGCGSTYYLSLAAASLLQSETGLACRAVPAGEMLMYPETVYSGNNNILFALSRSGSTTETVRAIEQFKKDKAGKVIAVTNYEKQPIQHNADLVLSIKEGQEESIAQTRSFCSMYFAITALAMTISGREELFMEMGKLPDLGDKLLHNYHIYAKDIGERIDIDRFYFLGSGHRYGLACEANLKMKEMTLTHTEAFHFMEFRHGPKSMVNEKTIVIGLLSDSKREYEEKVLSEVEALGATIISVGEKDTDISFRSDLPEQIRTILYLPVLQLIAFYRSLKKGLDPDKPKNLSSVVYLD